MGLKQKRGRRGKNSPLSSPPLSPFPPLLPQSFPWRFKMAAALKNL